MTQLREARSTPTKLAVLCAGLVHIYPGEDGPIVALRNLDLQVKAGEMVALLGPSGSGKSTLLSVLTGLLRPTAGRVLVGSHDVAQLDRRGLNRLRSTELSLLLQDPLQNLLPYANALENFAFAQRGARRRRWPLRWSPQELVETFGLEDLARRPIHRLSGGEQQKVAMASAIATSPSVLVADEPTTGLDPDGRDAVIESLQRAHELSDTTLIVATHDAVTAAAFPRTVTISHGMIGSEGRGGEHFAVVGRDGALQLPQDVIAMYPAGTLFHVAVNESIVELRPQRELDDESAGEP